MSEQQPSNRDTRYLEFAEKLIEEILEHDQVWIDTIYDDWREDWKRIIAQRVYDLVTPKEYIDKDTRVRMTVEHDIPGHPRVTVYPPDGNTLSIEQVNEAIRRLQQSAGLET